MLVENSPASLAPVDRVAPRIVRNITHEVLASLDPGHRAAQSRSANKLISPFLTSQRPVSGLCAPR